MIDVPKKIGSYSIYGTLGSGGYGQVVAAHNSNTLKNFAIKISEDRKSLKKEYKILKILQKNEDFMKVYEYGSQGNFDYIVLDLFGKNLQYKSNDYLLSLKTVSAIGLEILSKIEKIHNLDIIHKDIKPSQFLLSHDQKKIFLVDFGISTFFRVNNKHKIFKTKCRFKGSVLFSSINTHLGFRLSRRDDLESLAYSLLYLIRGELPWKILENINSSKYIKVILNQKLNIKRDYLFRGIPAEFESFFLYCRKLLYDQTPNYSYLKSLLSKFLQTEPIYANFDWIVEPEFFRKFESKVETNNKNAMLYIKNCNGEFMSKRRNAQMDLSKLRRVSKSFDVNDMKELINLKKKTVDVENPVKKSQKIKRKGIRSKSNKPKGMKLSNCLNVDGGLNVSSLSGSNENLQVLELKIGSYSACASGPVSVSSSIIIDETYDQECETSRNNMPEFLDRENIFKNREVFLEKVSEKVPQKCGIF